MSVGCRNQIRLIRLGDSPGNRRVASKYDESPDPTRNRSALRHRQDDDLPEDAGGLVSRTAADRGARGALAGKRNRSVACEPSALARRRHSPRLAIEPAARGGRDMTVTCPKCERRRCVRRKPRPGTLCRTCSQRISRRQPAIRVHRTPPAARAPQPAPAPIVVVDGAGKFIGVRIWHGRESLSREIGR